MKNVRVQGIFVGNREGFEAMNRAVAFHKIKPIVGQTFPLGQVQEALHLMAGRGHFGKLCLAFQNE